ncbi:cytochrome b/b6 domain-containing protein [Polynucleobacter difficilis]|uniref:cytochrome b/b6 domain-containing protein n=1 Tax=Polynucleobacter difficilis TaxID=556054 RepID=UPI000D3BA4D5|nr:cytochrome b/b6 domain-containing protein [Polynucleobacter difficilis]
MKRTLRIWDLPTRLFHWLLVVCIACAVICVNIGGNLMQWHAYFGYAALSLVLFRVLWGFIGAVHSRFVTFVPSPQRLIAFLSGKQGGGLGHSPLGSLSVIALLLVVGIQASTGLFTDDDIAFQGPLAKYVPNATVSLLSSIHALNSNILFGLIGLHLLAIGYYQWVKRASIVMPMIQGDKEVDVERDGSGLPAFALHASKDGAPQRLTALVSLCAIAVLLLYALGIISF